MRNLQANGGIPYQDTNTAGHKQTILKKNRKSLPSDRAG